MVARRDALAIAVRARARAGLLRDAAVAIAVRARARARVARGISTRGFYAKHLRAGDLSFDIGANVGDHAAAMAEAGGRVVAVEPQGQLAAAIERRLPMVTVLAVGVAERSGAATLRTSTQRSHLATFNPDAHKSPWGWDGEQTVSLITLDELIAQFGIPSFVKIDTEGYEDRVLAGLSQPVEQLLFEVHAALPEVAEGAFRRLEELGSYEYRVMEKESWCFDDPAPAGAILANLPGYGDVHARLLD